ncbi:sensor histidine kinase [Faecalicatena faecalis]|nr:HAMP domain-containing sensor histidine kinase [Faecalicatena faecalis]
MGRMEILAAAAVILAAGCTVAAWIFYRQKKNMYQALSRMMDDLLEDRVVTLTDLKEGEVSALAGKAKRLSEKLQSEIGQATQEKEQVKSLISNMSHQLKTPLTNIMMYEEILSSDGAAGTKLSKEDQKKFLAKMRAQSEKVDWILNSLFKMVRLEQNVIVFEAGPNLIRKTILDAVNLIYEKAQRKQIEIETEYFPDCSLFHNPRWTTEVFANLLENAVKYTPEGGKITIGMQRFEMYTEIRIRDTGIGIEQKEQTEIFKRFYRSRGVENQEGSGIGLYLSKLILEKEKGYMNVASRKGMGSCFSVFLQNSQE